MTSALAVLLGVCAAAQEPSPAAVPAANPWAVPAATAPAAATAPSALGNPLPWAIALGAALVFVESMKELELASTLQPFDFEAVSLKIHTLARFQAEQRIAPWALISQLMALPAIGVLLWRLRRG